MTSRGFWVEVLWQRLRALYGVGEAVIEVEAVLKMWTPRQGSPRNLGLAVAQLVKSAVNLSLAAISQR